MRWLWGKEGSVCAAWLQLLEAARDASRQRPKCVRERLVFAQVLRARRCGLFVRCGGREE
jgi:hypothetical protein